MLQTEQKQWTRETGWQTLTSSGQPDRSQLVLVFGDRASLLQAEVFTEINSWYPEADIVMGSSAGEIIDTKVHDGTIVLTAVQFEHTTLNCHQIDITNNQDSQTKGAELAGQLPKEHLAHVMVFSDGLKVNGTALVAGLLQELPEPVGVTGGLVGDGSQFAKTVLGLNEIPSEGKIIAVGFYGDKLKIGHGSLGGWETFGPERLITKSEGNVLYELDHKPALELYKEYLGEEAKDLPGSGLLFPLNLKVTDKQGVSEVVRTLLAVDEEANSMTFAGDMPEGAEATLMKANFDRLVDGAKAAAQMSTSSLAAGDSELAVLISCIGRKLVLKERIEEETEAVRAVLGDQAAMIGFYSYGEISPVAATSEQCRLHNQTMTITTFKEA